MAYKDIPGRPGWQFKDDPVNPANKQTALFNIIQTLSALMNGLLG